MTGMAEPSAGRGAAPAENAVEPRIVRAAARFPAFRRGIFALGVPGFLALAALGALAGRPPSPVCSHPQAGPVWRVSLAKVREAQESMKARLSWVAGEAVRFSEDSSYDSGLPACRARATRLVRTRVAPELAGRTIVFAAAEQMPPGDVRVATSARRLAACGADALADPRLTGRLGVRCTPTTVRVKSEVELELVEHP